METALLIWCAVLTLALAAHMVRDAKESSRVTTLEEQLRKLQSS
ncbi:MAG: hypothetical protein ACE5F1_08000 [Planctomycetota bacterium]